MIHCACFIGETTVGKTSILQRLEGAAFHPTQIPTIGATYTMHTESLGDEKLDIQVWDTAGQERFRALGPMYYRKASAALAVFAVDNPESFTALGTWIRIFEDEAGTNTIVFVVANKCDLIAPEIETVNLDEAKAWASDNGCRFAETSALSGAGIAELFRNLAIALAENRHIAPRVETTTCDAPEPSRCPC
jgi:small GTP-binding protein